MMECTEFKLRLFCTLLALGSIPAFTLGAPPEETSQPAGVVIDFFPNAKVRPKSSPYQLTITDLGKTPPAVSTTDRSKTLPRLTGSLRTADASLGSITLKLDGRSDDRAVWIGNSWTGGDTCLVKGSESGLGIDDEDGGNKVDGGEAIIWSFDLSRLKLAADESLVLTSANFGGQAEGKHAQFWQRAGRAGSKGAGKQIAIGGIWNGTITIANRDEFALAGNGRLRSLTLQISSTSSKPEYPPFEGSRKTSHVATTARGFFAASIEYDQRIPQLRFAAQELSAAARESGRENLKVTLTITPNAALPEAFQIRSAGSNRLEVVGSDSTGAMYGGLEVADRLRLGLPIENQDRRPFVAKRGVKINIPLDIRTPAFDDSGEAAQRNIQTMWDFEFWKEYLDDLARYRYNVVSLWAAHPFPTMIKLDEYPDIAVDDVYYSKEGSLSTTHLDAATRLEDTDGSAGLGKKISIDEKIKYWQKIFQYAQDRGIEIMMVHWNVHVHGAAGKYGITNAQDNPATIKYIRACVREMLLTYPQITGIGVCAGENDDRYLRDEYMTEHFVFNAYGKAVMDVKELQPDRDIRFIIRRHSTEYPDIKSAFKNYTGGKMETSVKYAVAHMYSSRRPQEWEKRIVDEGWLESYKVWLNLRNDDIFMHRWGSPDYARDFINWMPREHMAGFYMGSDTYVWGREFISKNPETAGRLEIDKHWYRFRLWGQLAYNNELGDEYWQAVLKHRFPGVDARLLLEAWESVSEVIPQLNRSVWSPTDGSFAAEGCRRTSGFLTLDGYQFERPAMVLNRIESAPDPQCITVKDWAQAKLAGKTLEGLTPLQVAENLDGYAAVAHAALPKLRAQIGDNVELKETLNDIDSMAYLGRYYADKMRGAAKLALYREGGRQDSKYLDQAAAHLEDAVEEWKAYAAVLTPQYKTQVGARANSMDWNGTLNYVEQEVETIKEEGDYPKLRFTNLADDVRIPEGADLRVEIDATDGDGAPEVRLRLNGQVAHAEEKRGDRFVWSAASDEILESLEAGVVHLEAVAVDKNGLRTSKEIDIQVGNAYQGRKDAWKNEIHEVILNEGETFKNGDIREFPRLNCYLKLEDDGSIELNAGSPGNREGEIWGTNGKANRPKPHPVPFRFYMAVVDGQLQIRREKPGRPSVMIYKTRPVPDSGPFKLGITASRSLAVFRENGKQTEIVWRSPNGQ